MTTPNSRLNVTTKRLAVILIGSTLATLFIEEASEQKLLPMCPLAFHELLDACSSSDPASGNTSLQISTHLANGQNTP